MNLKELCEKLNALLAEVGDVEIEVDCFGDDDTYQYTTVDSVEYDKDTNIVTVVVD
jgi:hypothetical protein